MSDRQGEVGDAGLPMVRADVLPQSAKAPSARLLAAAAAAADFADAGRADNTAEAYASDWRDFIGWCAAEGFPCDLGQGPVDGRVVALYLSARARPAAGVRPLAVSTLERRMAAIRTMHKDAGLAPPAGPELRSTLSGIRRKLGRPPRQKRALVVDDLRRVLLSSPNSLAGLRERALLLIGFGGALRRSELVAATLEGEGAGHVWVRKVGGGLEIHIDRSKADQGGKGAVVRIPHGSAAVTCPVRALTDWLEAAGIAQGPVFRPIDRVGRVGRGAISTEAAAQIIKAAVDRVGLDPRDFAGHSLRSGLATSAAANDADLTAIMRQGRWKKSETAQGYMREGDGFSRRNAARVAGL